MKCPVCSHSDLVISDRQGIEIDYCPECRGVWLDRGELDKIIERSEGVSNRRHEREMRYRDNRYRESDYHDDRYHGRRYYKDKRYKYKRKGLGYKLLKEIFD